MSARVEGGDIGGGASCGLPMSETSPGLDGGPRGSVIGGLGVAAGGHVDGGSVVAGLFPSLANLPH